MNLLQFFEAFQKRFSKDKTINICAGITPNNYLHVGSLREVFLSRLVQLKLLEEGYKSYFYWNIDDLDRVNEKDVNTLKGTVGRPVCEAGKFLLKDYLSFMMKFSVFPLPIRTSSLYKLEKFQDIVAQILSHKNLGLRENQSPFQVLSPITRTYDTEYVSFDQDTRTISYIDNHDNELKTVQLTPGEYCGKLVYRLEWFAKWNLVDTSIELIHYDHSINWDLNEEYNIGVVDIPLRGDYGRIKLIGGRTSKGRLPKDINNAFINIYEPFVLNYFLCSQDFKKDISYFTDIKIFNIYNQFDAVKEAFLNFGQFPWEKLTLEQQDSFKPGKNNYEVFRLLYQNAIGESPLCPPPFEKCVRAAAISHNYNDWCNVLNVEDHFFSRYSSAKSWLELNPESPYCDFTPDFSTPYSYTLDTFTNLLISKLKSLKAWDPGQVDKAIKKLIAVVVINPKVIYQYLNRLFYGIPDGFKSFHILYYHGLNHVINTLNNQFLEWR